MSIEELITFCEEKEYNHALNCKRYDDASGYTRSKNKDIRTSCAVREELLCDYYKQIAGIMRKYQLMQADYETRLKADMVAVLTDIQLEIEKQCKIPNNCASAYDWNNGVYACYKVVQQKIDALKVRDKE